MSDQFKGGDRVRDIAHEEERWLSLSRELELRDHLWELKERRRHLRRQPMTRATMAAARAIESLIYEVADEYWNTINYNRAKGWII